MVAPTTWQSPALVPTAPGIGQTRGFISKVGGYWFVVSADSSENDPCVRYATDPTGTWATATMPTAPPGTTEAVGPSVHGVQFDGTYYAFAVAYNTPSSAYRIIYCTDPTGTWTSYQYDATEAHDYADLIHDGTQWVMVGRKRQTGNDPAFIGTCSTPGGTWTFYTAFSETGYDLTALSGTTSFWDILSIDYDGASYVTAAQKSNSGSTYEMRHSSSLLASWGTPTFDSGLSGTRVDVLRAVEGKWLGWASSQTTYLYASAGTGTWFGCGTAQHQIVNPEVIGYGNGTWVVGGATGSLGGSATTPTLSYLVASTPSSTFATANPDVTGTSNAVAWLHYDSGTWMLADYATVDLRYSNVTDPPVYRRPIGRSMHLRQRQTPFIT